MCPKEVLQPWKRRLHTLDLPDLELKNLRVQNPGSLQLPRRMYGPGYESPYTGVCLQIAEDPSLLFQFDIRHPCGKHRRRTDGLLKERQIDPDWKPGCFVKRVRRSLNCSLQDCLSRQGRQLSRQILQGPQGSGLSSRTQKPRRREPCGAVPP